MAEQNKATQKAGQQAADAGGENQTFTQADLDAAKAEGVTEGRQMERDRYAAVMSSEHYAGREGLASKMLAKESLSAEDINEMLADAPKVEKAEQPTEGANAFENAMDNSDNPNMGVEADDQGGESEGSSLLKNYAAAAGVKLS